MFRVIDQQLYFNDQVLGPADSLYLDTKELPSITGDSVVRLHMPERIDCVFTAGSKVVGCEFKFPADTVTSFHSRRIQRQVRHMLKVCDIVVVVARGGLPTVEDVPEQLSTTPENAIRSILEGQCAWLSMGVRVVTTPADDAGTLSILRSIREFEVGAKNPLSAITGQASDEPRKERSNLLQAIPGVGRTTAIKLKSRFGSVSAALCKASDEDWKNAGANVRAIEGRRKAMQ